MPNGVILRSTIYKKGRVVMTLPMPLVQFVGVCAAFTTYYQQAAVKHQREDNPKRTDTRHRQCSVVALESHILIFAAVASVWPTAARVLGLIAGHRHGTRRANDLTTRIRLNPPGIGVGGWQRRRKDR